MAPWFVPRPLPRGQRWIPLLSVVVTIPYLLFGYLANGSVSATVRSWLGAPNMSDAAALGLAPIVVTVIIGVGAALLVPSVRVAVSPPTDRNGWVRAVGMASLIGGYAATGAPVTFGHLESGWSLALTLFLVVTLAALWITAGVRSGNRFGLAVGLAWLGLGLLGYLYQLLPANADARLHDAYGLNGIMRLVGWVILVYAILRADLLQIKLPRLAVSRGAVAAGALATLFIVAQIAQNFLSAEYGLVSGGIIAGAVLFAASPVQRAIERVSERRPSKQAPRAGVPDETAFRQAVELAFRDRRFDESEEIALAKLADRLGVSAHRTAEIRHQVERAKGVR